MGGALTVAAGASVVMPGVTDVCKGTDVFWQVGDNVSATALTTSTFGAGATFVGNVLALGDLTLLGNAAVDGRLVSLGEVSGTTVNGGHVTLAANAVSACSFGNPLPTHTAFKVTGGGSINVPSDRAETIRTPLAPASPTTASTPSLARRPPATSTM